MLPPKRNEPEFCEPVVHETLVLINRKGYLAGWKKRCVKCGKIISAIMIPHGRFVEEWLVSR
jgi:hypothetical protein